MNRRPDVALNYMWICIAVTSCTAFVVSPPAGVIMAVVGFVAGAITTSYTLQYVIRAS